MIVLCSLSPPLLCSHWPFDFPYLTALPALSLGCLRSLFAGHDGYWQAQVEHVHGAEAWRHMGTRVGKHRVLL